MGATFYEINDKSFEMISKLLERFVVVFTLEESIPCKHFLPEFFTCAMEFDGSVSFYRIRVDENPEVSERMKILCVPTTVLYRKGSEDARWEGPYSHESLSSRIRTRLLVDPKK